MPAGPNSQRSRSKPSARLRRLPDWLPWRLLSQTRPSPTRRRRLVLALATFLQLCLLALAAAGSANGGGGGGADWQLRQHLRGLLVDAPRGLGVGRIPRNATQPLTTVRDAVAFWRWCRVTLLPVLYGTASLLRPPQWNSSSATNFVYSHDASLIWPKSAPPRLRRMRGSSVGCPASMPTALIGASGRDCLLSDVDPGATKAADGVAAAGCGYSIPGLQHSARPCLGRPRYLDANVTVAMATINQLANSSWAFDRRTRAVAVEFFLYQPAHRLLAVCQALLELPTVGAGVAELHIRVATVRDYARWPAGDALALTAELVGLVSACVHASLLLARALLSETGLSRFCHALTACILVATAAAAFLVLPMRCAFNTEAARRLLLLSPTAADANSLDETFPTMLRAVETAEAFTNLLSALVFLFSLRLVQFVQPSTLSATVLQRASASLTCLVVAMLLLCTAGTVSLLADVLGAARPPAASALPAPGFFSLLISLLAAVKKSARSVELFIGGPPSLAACLIVSATLVAAILLACLFLAVLLRERRAAREASHRPKDVVEDSEVLANTLLALLCSWLRRFLHRLVPDPRLNIFEDYLPSDERRIANNLKQISMRLHQLHISIICLFNEHATDQELAADLLEVNEQYYRQVRWVYQSEHPNEWSAETNSSSRSGSSRVSRRTSLSAVSGREIEPIEAISENEKVTI